MRIVAETSLGRIGKKYAEFANAPWRPNGTDPTLHIPTSYDLHHKAITRFLGKIPDSFFESSKPLGKTPLGVAGTDQSTTLDLLRIGEVFFLVVESLSEGEPRK
uniref:Transposase n=1 Tax=Heterorhabditis bacteriophora TaxID=37862 RepID=A0A1I7W792_HETBA